MNLLEYADVIDRQLIMTYPSINGEFYVDFEGCEIMEDGILKSACGYGKTPDEALKNYVNEIKGQRIVFGAYQDGRVEFKVPKNLSY